MERDADVLVVAECEALCKAYGECADARDADGLAALYIEDGVFDRFGQRFVGRHAIRDVIASRPAGVWTRHAFINCRIDVGADRKTATGTVSLEMQRGRDGASEIEHIRAECHDAFVLTGQGWRFASRKVVPTP